MLYPKDPRFLCTLWVLMGFTCTSLIHHDNIREWTGLELAKSQRAVENRENWRELVVEVIRVAPTTLAATGWLKVEGERESFMTFVFGGIFFFFKLVLFYFLSLSSSKPLSTNQRTN